MTESYVPAAKFIPEAAGKAVTIFEDSEYWQ